jgi:4-hydroxybenzoate polyprenyltransferase
VRRFDLVPLVQAARPHQWTKNLLLFAGLLFSGRFQDASAWPAAIAIFAAYCLASSAAYLVNDVRDAALDRVHPRKRDRPVAAGRLLPQHAIVAAVLGAVAAVCLAATTGTASVALLLAFLGLQLAYSLRLKHVAFVDVLAIATLFVIRAVAGAVAVDVPFSRWLVGCTGLLALFLALAKRRAELRSEADAASGRPVLERYGTAPLDGLVLVAGAAAGLAYAVYAFRGPWAPAMALTIPLVALGLGRYAILVRSHELDQEPERLLIRDRILLLTIGAWVVLATAILVVEV